jgi:hypothetical protein
MSHIASLMRAANPGQLNKLSICCCSHATPERYLLRNTLRSPFGQSPSGFGQSVPGVEAVMAHILNEVLLYCCVAAFVTGIVLAAATLIS